MRERGYMMSCHRCGREEFVSKDKIESWKGLVLMEYEDKPLDICPTCAALFNKLSGYFISSYESGIRMYLEDGTPIIFTPMIDKSMEKDVDEEPSVKEKSFRAVSSLKKAYNETKERGNF